MQIDTDIHIPFFVRGPNIQRGGSVDSITTHTDVSSTILRIAGVSKLLDGSSIPLGDEGNEFERHEHAQVEFWGLVSRLA